MVVREEVIILLIWTTHSKTLANGGIHCNKLEQKEAQDGQLDCTRWKRTRKEVVHTIKYVENGKRVVKIKSQKNNKANTRKNESKERKVGMAITKKEKGTY